MVDNSWISDVQTSVYSRLKAISKTYLEIEYPNINYTTNPVDPTNATFPTIYVHEVDILPLADGMERKFNTKDNYYLQVEVFANDSSQVDSRKIGKILMNIMNSFGFQGVPLTEYNTNYSRTVARYSKEIHADSDVCN